MNIQLLPSSFDASGRATSAQRLTCFLIDERVAVDAGSIGIALTEAQRRKVRDVIITHPHMDHIASLPIYVDDMFAEVEEPIRIHATQEVIDLLKRDAPLAAHFYRGVTRELIKRLRNTTRDMGYFKARAG